MPQKPKYQRTRKPLSELQARALELALEHPDWSWREINTYIRDFDRWVVTWDAVVIHLYDNGGLADTDWFLRTTSNDAMKVKRKYGWPRPTNPPPVQRGKIMLEVDEDWFERELAHVNEQLTFYRRRRAELLDSEARRTGQLVNDLKIFLDSTDADA
jgi:hypothetical protein